MNPNRFRCPECRTRRTSFVALVQHCRDHDHKVCHCGGYHYAHRPGSPYCERNPMSGVRHALRFGGFTADELMDIAIESAWEKPGRSFTTWRD